jgi:hypothetical protein
MPFCAIHLERIHGNRISNDQSPSAGLAEAPRLSDLKSPLSRQLLGRDLISCFVISRFRGVRLVYRAFVASLWDSWLAVCSPRKSATGAGEPT